MKKLRILFIGNSHTYYNDMPNMVAEKSRKEGYDCEVTMIAHGWMVFGTACSGARCEI